MSVVLYQMAHSNFCIAIAQSLRACGVNFEIKEIPNWDRSEVLRLTNGVYYAVPVIVDNGTIVYESGASTQDVAQYVNRAFAGGRLFPKALAAPHECTIDFLENELEDRTFRLADIHYVPSIADVAQRGIVIRHKERRFGRGCVDAWRQDAARIRTEADRLLSRFETTLSEQPFLFGNEPVYADFLLFGLLGNFTM